MQLRAFAVLPLLILAACPTKPDDTAPDTPEADTDTDTDADTDVPACDEATELTFSGGVVTSKDTIDPAGDRDFFFIQPTEGDAVGVYTKAYALDKDMEPDTVLRLYDSTCTFVTENDDMPYRSQETDSALFWQATDPDGYYVEVLEWSDWDGTGTATGGADFEYDLAAFHGEVSDYEPNDDLSEADKAYDGGATLFTTGSFDDFSTWYWGEIAFAGDVDVYPLEWTSSVYAQWSLWPTWLGNLDAELSLFDSQGTLLATTGDPMVNPEWTFIYDAGITYLVEAGERYYLEVRDASGGGGEGAGYFYPGVIVGYVDTLADYEVEPNDADDPQSLSWIESDSYAGYYYARFAGALNGDGDAVDAFLLESEDVDGLEGNYLSFYLETARQGSLLDAEISIYQQDREGSLTLLDSATVHPEGSSSDDPEIWDVELPTDLPVVVTVEHELAADAPDPSHNHFGLVVIYSSPIN